MYNKDKAQALILFMLRIDYAIKRTLFPISKRKTTYSETACVCNKPVDSRYSLWLFSMIKSDLNNDRHIALIVPTDCVYNCSFLVQHEKLCTFFHFNLYLGNNLIFIFLRYKSKSWQYAEKGHKNRAGGNRLNWLIESCHVDISV